jgi:hypothetical protein
MRYIICKEATGSGLGIFQLRPITSSEMSRSLILLLLFPALKDFMVAIYYCIPELLNGTVHVFPSKGIRKYEVFYIWHYLILYEIPQ